MNTHLKRAKSFLRTLVRGHKQVRTRRRNCLALVMMCACCVFALQHHAKALSLVTIQSLQMLSPGPTGISTHNQNTGAMPYTVFISDHDAEISSGKHSFRGVAKGMQNVAVVCPAGGKWFMAQPAADGSFSVDVDVPDLMGPMSVEVYSWDSAPDDGAFRVNINARFDLFVIGSPEKQTVQMPFGMKLVWSEEFAGPISVSSSKHQDAEWYSGGKPSSTGSQYSSASFVPVSDRRNPFFVKNGFLRIRATHSSTNPTQPGGQWWSGHLSTGFPDESASIQFRKGYAEARMKLPVGPGAWPAFWLLDSSSTLPSKAYGAVEIDAVEAYGHDQSWYMATEHRWPGFDQGGTHTYVTEKVQRRLQAEEGFHTYGVRLTDNEVIWYFDSEEVYRAPLYRAEVVSPFYLMIDLAMGGGWPVAVPPSEYYDLWVKSVHVYE